MAKDYLHQGDYKLTIELQKWADVADPNRTYAFEYKAYLEANNRKSLTTYRRLSELRYIFGFVTSKDAKQLTKRDAESIVRCINVAKRRLANGQGTNEDMASITKGKMKLTFKAFMKWLYDSKDYPDCVDWIKVKTDSTKKLPEDMLSEEDVNKLIGACLNQRDKTIIALLWDAGLRIGELLNLKMKDFSLEKEGISHLVVSGKTGMRQAGLVFSVPYLANYINDMRKTAKPDEPLFIVINHNRITDRPLDYTHVLKLLRDLKERAGFTKRVYPHLFRHSRATYYANKLTEQQLKEQFGWVGDSAMMAQYVHLSGRDMDSALSKANGLSSKRNEIQKPQIRRCFKCDQSNEVTAILCSNCGSSLDTIERIGELDKLQQKIDHLENLIEYLVKGKDLKQVKEDIRKESIP